MAVQQPSSKGTTCEYLFVEVPDPAHLPAANTPWPLPPTPAEDGAASAPCAPRPSFVRLLHRVPAQAKHPLQFGREILCRLLNAPDKIEWKKCAVGQEAETLAVTAFRKAFAPFDFTLGL